MRTCQAVIAARDGDQHECGVPAKFLAYDPPTYFCAEHLHDCMQDASIEEQATIRELPDDVREKLGECP